MNQIIIASLFLTVALTVTGRPSESESYSTTTENLTKSFENDDGRGGGIGSGQFSGGHGISIGKSCEDVAAHGCVNILCGRTNGCTLEISSDGITSKTKVKFGNLEVCCPTGPCRVCL